MQGFLFLVSREDFIVASVLRRFSLKITTDSIHGSHEIAFIGLEIDNIPPLRDTTEPYVYERTLCLILGLRITGCL